MMISLRDFPKDFLPRFFGEEMGGHLMSDLTVFDLKFGFYIKDYRYGLSPRSEVENPDQNMRGNMVT